MEISEINGRNTKQQHSMIALLGCLEALLGVVNACLPVTKPVFRKLGVVGIFCLFWPRAPTATAGKQINTPRLSPVDQVSRGARRYPYISHPRQIVYKGSLEIFRPDLANDVRAPSIPPPSFSWRPLSGFYLPRAEWEHDPADLSKENIVTITTDWNVGRRPSEGDSPTLPWRPQWHNRHKFTARSQ